jgi:hypothetical protein
MTNIGDSNLFGKLDSQELKAFEEQHGVTLPGDYKSFLKKHNGGSPEPAIEPVIGTPVQWLYGLHRGENWASLYWLVETVLHNHLPDNLLPIAHDPGGNLFILSLREVDHGHIYFWDHESETETDPLKFYRKLKFVAESFTIFIDSLEDHVHEGFDHHEEEKKKRPFWKFWLAT